MTAAISFPVPAALPTSIKWEVNTTSVSLRTWDGTIRVPEVDELARICISMTFDAHRPDAPVRVACWASSMRCRVVANVEVDTFGADRDHAAGVALAALRAKLG